MGASANKTVEQNRKGAQGQSWLQDLQGQQQPGIMQQIQPMLNQLLGHHGGKSTRLNMDGTLKDMNAPSGLDWLEAHGPGRASVQERQQRLGQELRPGGGLPWMAQQGAQAVEAQKQLQQMLPQNQHSVTQQWGGDDVGAVSTAMRNGEPVGFSTNTPQAKTMHQFSPHDFVSMLGQLPKAAPAQIGSLPQPGAEQLPVNSFVGHTTNNPDNFFVRDKAGVRAREQERQRHNVYKDQAQPQSHSTSGSSWRDQLGGQRKQQVPEALSAGASAIGNVVASALNRLQQAPTKFHNAYEYLGSGLPSWVYDEAALTAARIPGYGLVSPETYRKLLPQGEHTLISSATEGKATDQLNFGPYGQVTQTPVTAKAQSKQPTSSAAQGFMDSPLGWLLSKIPNITGIPY